MSEQTYIEALSGIREYKHPDNPVHVMQMIHDGHAVTDHSSGHYWLCITNQGKAVLRAVGIK